jgi:TetR/AcrR family transcriptional regulator, lmrAB and yxaGH operons repressor
MAEHHIDPPPDTRARLTASMQQALRSSGYHGTGLSAVLAAAQCPKGVLYHHFPKGKAELASAAINQVARAMALQLEKIFASADPFAGLQAMLTHAIARVVDSNFIDCCPLARACLDASEQEPVLQNAVKSAFELLQTTIADGFTRLGLPESRASLLSSVVLSTYEGALLMVRAHREAELAEATALFSLSLVRAELDRTRAATSPKSPRSAPHKKER